VLVAVSGGPDSLALLLNLKSLQGRMGITLHIAHLDHGIRKNSPKDADFVKKTGEKLRIPVTAERLPGLNKNKGSLEELLRSKRQEFLIRTAERVKADKIALGHNLDDQAETVLMRILRGTGLSGLSGIAAKRTIHGKIFIRPLLETSRLQIESFLKRNRIKPRIDPTNRKDLFMRNRIRRQLMPLLKKKYNPNIVSVLAGLAENSSCDYEYLEWASRKNTKKTPGKLVLKKTIKLHPAILRLRLRHAIRELQGDTRRITFRHIKELEDLLFFRKTGSIVDLPKGIYAQKSKKYILFQKRLP
jgi:tRNA(Ile)-lysidine synthase